MDAGHSVHLASRVGASGKRHRSKAVWIALPHVLADGGHCPGEHRHRAGVLLGSPCGRRRRGSLLPGTNVRFHGRCAMKIAIVLCILLATVVGALAYGRRTRRSATLAEWAVGGRSLGTLIFWFMNAGEVYTTFAVLGISGYAWALGAPAYLAFCSVSELRRRVLVDAPDLESRATRQACHASRLLCSALRRALARRDHWRDRDRLADRVRPDPVGEPWIDRATHTR